MDEFRGQEHAILGALGIHWHGAKKVSGKMRCPFPHHEDVHPSWRWSESGRSDGRPGWICSCGAGDILDAVEAMGRAQGVKACRDWARDAIGAQPARKSSAKPAPKADLQPYQPANQPPTLAQLCHARYRRPTAVYIYHDADELIAEVRARYEHDGGKDVVPWTFDGARWVPRQMPGKRPLYHLPALLADPFSPVLVVEGEGKKCERAAELFPDYAVTSCSGGCKAASGMDFTPLQGRAVVVWPDNDAPGRSYASDVARFALENGASEVRVVSVPRDWPKAWDLGDEPPNDSIDLREMLDEAQTWQNDAASCLNGARSCEIGADASENVSHESVLSFETHNVSVSKTLARQEAEIIPFSTLSSAAVSQSAQERTQASKSFRFPIIPLTAMRLVLDGQWLIHGLLPSKGLSVVYGAPGCGKSFLVLDAMLHVAGGLEWAGRRVEKANVLYIAAEGQAGFQNRVLAAAERLKLPADTRFALICVAPNLGSQKGDAELLIEEIRAQAEVLGWVPDVVVIDTLSRVMAGADESSPEGMGAFIGNCGLISDAFGLALPIHHKGKDEAKGMRGWSGLHGAADSEWDVQAEEARHSVTLTKMKDGADGLSWHFAMPVIEIGKDQYDVAVTTRVVDITSEAQHREEAKNVAPKKATGQAAEFLKAIKWAIEESGDILPPVGRVPPHVRGVTKATVAKYAKSLDFIHKKEANAQRSVMARHFQGLAGNGFIAQWEDYVWLL